MGYVIEASPQHEHRLGEHVLGGVGVSSPAQKPEDSVAVQTDERLVGMRAGLHTFIMAGGGQSFRKPAYPESFLSGERSIFVAAITRCTP